jgi:hypothetical protein
MVTKIRKRGKGMGFVGYEGFTGGGKRYGVFSRR